MQFRQLLFDLISFQWFGNGCNRVRSIRPVEDTEVTEHANKRVKRYTIMVGLNDKDENIQKFQTDRIIKLVTNCCKQYKLAFSCYKQEGGYNHFNGKGYILEKSLAIVLNDPIKEVVDELCKDLCAFLNQESVLVTVEDVEMYFVSCSVTEE